MTLTVDREFEHFLTTRPLALVWQEKPVTPRQVLVERDYQEQTDRILDAMHSGSEARLELALTGWEAA